MSYQDRPASTLERAQTVTTYLLREPVKDAVKEALREEAVSVRQTREGDTDVTETAADGSEPGTDDSTDQDGSGAPKLPIGLGLVVVAGIAYFLRRRQQSGSADYETESFDHGVDRPESEPSVETGQDDTDGSVTSVSDQT